MNRQNHLFIHSTFNIIELFCFMFFNCLQVTYFIFFTESGYSFRCQVTDYSTSSQGMYEAHMCYAYFILKISDLFDTIFFILRKKTAHVSFLHVYHHVMITIGAYICVLYATGNNEQTSIIV